MKITPAKDISLNPVDVSGARDVKMRLLISPEEAPHFSMRLFEVEKDGHTPLHTHNFEHEVFIVDGQGELIVDGDNKKFSTGYVVYVPADKKHQFRNTGPNQLRFLCVVPNQY
ncbi:MAG: cupin domain-containing protein [Planctomycetes bacterium]|nr:cupin domain-containing protein [Planctomycetota bacterium]